MLSVIICEDIPEQRKNIEKHIMGCIEQKEYDADVVFSSGNPLEVLKYLKQNPLQNGLYILDVDLKHEMNGIALAAKIREKDTYGTIVFFTTHAEMSYLTFRYKVAAVDYIIKDAPGAINAEIDECLDLAYRRYLDDSVPKKRATYPIKSGSHIRNIPLDDILFFESHPKTAGKISLRTRDSRLEQYGALRDVEKIGSHFYRCHNAFVVNLNNIESVDKSKLEITMQGGSVIYVTTRKMKELLRRMT